jgi:hypothetical protein
MNLLRFILNTLRKLLNPGENQEKILVIITEGNRDTRKSGIY